MTLKGKKIIKNIQLGILKTKAGLKEGKRQSKELHFPFPVGSTR